MAGLEERDRGRRKARARHMWRGANPPPFRRPPGFGRAGTRGRGPVWRCGAAGAAASWVVRIFDSFRRGDGDPPRPDQEALIGLVAALRAGVFPASIKAPLQLQGICEPWPAPPPAALDDAGTARLRENLDRWGLLSTRRD